MADGVDTMDAEATGGRRFGAASIFGEMVGEPETCGRPPSPPTQTLSRSKLRAFGGLPATLQSKRSLFLMKHDRVGLRFHE